MMMLGDGHAIGITRFSPQSEPVLFEPPKKSAKQAILFFPFFYTKMNHAENEPKASSFYGVVNYLKCGIFLKK